MADNEAVPAVKKQYPLGRDFHASARLHLQHLLWNVRLGYLLHPSIPIATNTSFCIADIGTGNGLWPLELSRHLPSTAQIRGYDISPAQFPAKEWPPPSVHFDILDILSPDLPEELVNAFDVVHIRAFAVVVKGDDPGRVLEKLYKMLKPGGYLQWDEVDIGAYCTESPNAAVADTGSRRLVQYIVEYFHECGFQFGWIKNISKAFLNAGLDVMQATHLPVDNTTRKLETDNHLMALEDTLPDIARHVAEKSEVGFETAKQDLDALLQRAVEEMGRGVCLRMEWYSCLGRKSE